MKHHKALPPVVFVGNLCQELADTNAAVAEKAEYLFRIYSSALGRCIRSAQDAGEVNRDADPDRLAEAIFNSWEGAILRMKSSRNIQPLNAFLDMLAVLSRIILAVQDDRSFKFGNIINPSKGF